MKYRVIEAHRGPDRPPLSLRQGEHVTLGATYAGPEGWPDWIWGVSGAGVGAWIPLPVLEKTGKGTALAREAYDSTELDTEVGDDVAGSREMCGWAWCVRDGDGASGWVPLEKLAPRP
jgi:SH3-like domain-containing protein